MKLMRKQGGFTLVELLVVVVVIGILTAIIVPRLSGAKEAANEASCKSNLRLLQTGLAQYYTMNDEYPATLADVDVNANAKKCPADETDYTYTVESGSYTLQCSKHGLTVNEDGFVSGAPSGGSEE